MIGSLRGVVTERRTVGEATVELIVDVHGVGYRVLTTPRTAAARCIEEANHGSLPPCPSH